MRILVAPDKFKGSLTAAQAAEAICAGLRDQLPAADFDIQLLADGGEGTTDAVTQVLGGTIGFAVAQDPLDRPVNCRYGWVPASRTVVIEMAEASGLWRLTSAERNPLRANTFGTGQLLAEAIRLGAETVLIGLGGSATNDAGAGLAAALGYTFLDAAGNSIPPEPGRFLEIVRVVAPAQPLSAVCVGLSDVTNPLLGARGATRVFGTQKGALDLERLEQALDHFSSVVERDLGVHVRENPGAGAAGGLGFGLMAFCGATLRSGFDALGEWTGLESRVKACDWVVTAEGSLDSQTLDGKGPGALALMAKKHGKSTAAIAGRIADREQLAEIFDVVLDLSETPLPLEESIARAAELLRSAAGRLGSLPVFTSRS